MRVCGDRLTLEARLQQRREELLHFFTLPLVSFLSSGDCLLISQWDTWVELTRKREVEIILLGLMKTGCVPIIAIEGLKSDLAGWGGVGAVVPGSGGKWLRNKWHDNFTCELQWIFLCTHCYQLQLGLRSFPALSTCASMLHEPLCQLWTPRHELVNYIWTRTGQCEGQMPS